MSNFMVNLMNTQIRLCVFVIALFVAGSVWAEPSVDETKAFISGKFEACGEFALASGSNSKITTDIRVSFVGDEVHISQIVKYESPYYGVDKHWTYINTAKLNELSPNVTVKNLDDPDIVPFIDLVCHTKICWKSKSKITLHKKDDVVQDDEGKEKEYASDNENVYVCSEDRAKSMAKAFSHLIKKSGGKKELF